MLDWYAARMMAWIGDLDADGWRVVDSFPSERYPVYDHLVAVAAEPKRDGVGADWAELMDSIPIGEKWTTAYADGTPQELVR